MKTYTLTENKTLAIPAVQSVKTHSDLSLLVTTADANYFAGMAEYDHKNGTVTLTPVTPVDVNFDEEAEFEELLP